MNPEQLSTLEAWRTAGETVVFTNGVFDILHAGHVTYLEEAKAMGTKLVVGLNSDDSVRRLGKGPERPINGESDRRTVLAALRSVDLVVVFEGDTPERLIESVRPDVLVKGGDYHPDAAPGTREYIVGSEGVRARGGKVAVIPLLPGRSTTNIIKKSRSI